MKKLELLYPAHTQHRRGKSSTRIPSSTKQTSTDRDKEIEDLRNKIKLLKQDQREHDTQTKHTENKKEHPEPKNIDVAPALGGHTQTNIDLLKALNFIQETMQALSKYSQQLQTHLDINLTFRKCCKFIKTLVFF